MNTICAPSTASGGAIGVIRISGPDAVSFCNKIFSKDITNAKGYTLHYGTIQSTSTIDDVIISVFRAPHSYTGEDSVEICHHGSSYIQQQIMNLLLEGGCVMAQPGEFTQRAFMNGKMDLSQAEAVADLIASTNANSHRIAMDQMRGGIANKLKTLRQNLLTMTSLLELELDFSEEDVEFADRQRLIQLANEIRTEISRLIDSFSAGNAIKNGIPVAIIGAPNVGKSTLLNALLKDDKAIVSDIQGTTRDLIEDTMTIGGYQFRFIDTAGIRKTDDTIETLGIERSFKAATRAQIIIMLTEPGVPYPQVSIDEEQQHVIRIVNKSHDFQAINGMGVPQLEQQLVAFAAELTTNKDGDEVIITNLRHKQALELALQDINLSLQSLNQGISGDLIAEDLRQCIHHLGEITGGEIVTDEVLGNIFKNFCIGK